MCTIPLQFSKLLLLFSAIELQALKEEFSHHQDKVDQYYALLDEVEAKPGDDLSEYQSRHNYNT